jgi:hypothetical protein
VHQLEIAKDGRQLSPLESWQHNNLKKLSLALSSLLRTVAQIRSRIHWLRNGDANTSLFHAHARYRQKKNFIANLKDGEQTVNSHEGKAQLLWNFYSELLGARGERPYSLNLAALGLQEHDLSSLDTPTSEDKVFNTIKHMPNDKAPGPDGLTGRFYKSCWQIIKGDVMAVVSAVWRRDFRNFRQLNSAFITLLLPKKVEAQHP